MINIDFDEILDGLKNKAEEFKDAASKKGSEAFNNLKDVGINKLESVIKDLNDALPLIEEAGFLMYELEVEIGIMPRLFPHFLQIKSIEEEKQKDILERAKDKRLIYLLISALFRSENLKKSVKIIDMEYQEVVIEIGLTPSVKLIFRNRNFNYLSLVEKSLKDDESES